jgi:hypothetical protein
MEDTSVLVEPITEEEQRELSVQMMSPLMEKLNDIFISSMYHLNQFKTFIELRLKYDKTFRESYLFENSDLCKNSDLYENFNLFQVTYGGNNMYKLTYYVEDRIVKKITYQLDAIVDKLVEIFKNASDYRLQMCKIKTASIVEAIQTNVGILKLYNVEIFLEGICIELTPRHGRIFSADFINYGHKLSLYKKPLEDQLQFRIEKNGKTINYQCINITSLSDIIQTILSYKIEKIGTITQTTCGTRFGNIILTADGIVTSKMIAEYTLDTSKLYILVNFSQEVIDYYNDNWREHRPIRRSDYAQDDSGLAVYQTNGDDGLSRHVIFNHSPCPRLQDGVLRSSGIALSITYKSANYLIVVKDKTKPKPTLIGGTANLGEDSKTTAIRECIEETTNDDYSGIDLANEELVEIATVTFKANLFGNSNIDDTYTIYKCNIDLSSGTGDDELLLMINRDKYEILYQLFQDQNEISDGYKLEIKNTEIEYIMAIADYDSGSWLMEIHSRNYYDNHGTYSRITYSYLEMLFYNMPEDMSKLSYLLHAVAINGKKKLFDCEEKIIDCDAPIELDNQEELKKLELPNNLKSITFL